MGRLSAWIVVALSWSACPTFPPDGRYKGDDGGATGGGSGGATGGGSGGATGGGSGGATGGGSGGATGGGSGGADAGVDGGCPTRTFCPIRTSTNNQIYYGVWGTTANDVWVVGAENDQSLMLHFDGVGWDRKVVEPTTKPLRAVWGLNRSDYWAVGEGVTFHFDGGTWGRIPSPIDSAMGQLVSVFGLSTSDVTAVSEYPGPQLIIHWDGSQWVDRTAPLPVAATTSVWAGAGTTWLVGPSFNAVYYRDGGWGTGGGAGWSQHSVPFPTFLNTIWGFSGTDVWVAGNEGRIAHYDGTTWTSARPEDAGVYLSLWGARPDEVWLGGENGVLTTVQWDAGLVRHVHDAGTSGNVENIWGSSADDVFFVTRDAVLRRRR